jgi:holliday junction DNA helicase RuvA
MDNQTISRRLRDYATRLQGEGPNLYRVRAYRQAAMTVQRQDLPLTKVMADQGRKGLERLPGIGSHIAYTIEGLIQTGEFRTKREEKKVS